MADDIDADLRRGLECYARNGRWGTCGECPRTSDGRVFPEFCRLTERFDHQKALLDLLPRRNRDLQKVIEAWAEAADERERRGVALDKAVAFLRDLEKNYDCDQDAHRHGYAESQCRCCKARALQAEIDQIAPLKGFARG